MAQIAARNLKDITEAIRWARDMDKALEIYTGGSKRAIGRPAADSHRLCLKALDQVLFYHPEELVIGVQAAAPLADIEQLLAQKGQMLAFEPPDWGALFSVQNRGRHSCGGVVASNLSGPRRLCAGAARDHVLGFRAISGRGVRFRSGGSVVKNVTGYDVSKLMAGSWGTLAVLDEIIFKTMPAAEATRSLFIYDKAESDALQLMERLLSKSYGITGAAHIPARTARSWSGLESETALTAFRLEGTARATEAALADLRAALDSAAVIRTSEDEASRQFWRSVRDLDVFSAPWGNIAAPLWRILTPPSAAAGLAARIAAELEDVIYFIDWGGGLIWASHDVSSGEGGLESFSKKAGQIRNICLELGAEAMLIRASAEARRHIDIMPPLSGALAALTARIKHAFDPKAILNPGRLYFGI